jgi:hypothetical protein
MIGFDSSEFAVRYRLRSTKKTVDGLKKQRVSRERRKFLTIAKKRRIQRPPLTEKGSELERVALLKNITSSVLNLEGRSLKTESESP